MAHKPMPLALLIPFDAVLVAGSLLTFAYFHHVRPRVTKADKNLLEYIDSLQQNSVADVTVFTNETTTYVSTGATGTGSSTVTLDTTVTAGETVLSDGSGQAGTETQITEQGENTTTSPMENGGGTVTVSLKSAGTTTTTTTTTGPQYDRSGFGAKWPTLFSLGNEIETTDTTYRSHNVYISITPYDYADSHCYVADIYLRNVNSFKYAFAQDGNPATYANGLVTGLQENIMDMSSRTNAILAINGDFMGGRTYGMVIRDAYPWRTSPWNDVAALYRDGSVETFSRDEFDVYAAFERGILHSFAFGPALVRNGAVQSGFTAAHLTGKEPRSGFGYYEPGHYCFAAVDGRGMGGSAGMTAEEFAEFFGDIGCQQAFNLDGGKTSQMVFNGKVVNLPDGYNGSSYSLRGMSDIYYIGEANG